MPSELAEGAGGRFCPTSPADPAAVPNWADLVERARGRYEDGERRLPDDPDARQRQLTRMGNAATAAGLSSLMTGRSDAGWFTRAAERYRESWEGAPPNSWGRPIGAVKARILAGDWEAAADDARWTLEAGAAEADSPIARYAAALALLVLGDWGEARVNADQARASTDFPGEVADALAAIAAEDVVGYLEAVEDVLSSFETRSDYLEEIPVADTVLVLQALAGRRGMAAVLDSPLLP